MKEGSLDFSNYDEKIVEETISLSDYSGKKRASSSWNYWIHFYEDLPDKTLKIGVGLV